MIWFGWNLNQRQWGEKMRKKVVIVAVEMTINEGQLENFKKAVSAMTALCESEPGTLGYEFFLSADLNIAGCRRHTWTETRCWPISPDR